MTTMPEPGDDYFLTPHAFDYICKGHDHPSNHPPLDGVVVIRYVERDWPDKVITMHDAIARIISSGVEIHPNKPRDPHSFIPMHRVREVVQHPPTPGWYDKYLSWYEMTHGMSYAEAQEMTLKGHLIQANTEAESLMRNLFGLSPDEE